MKGFINIYILLLLLLSMPTLAKGTCDILIHGFSFNTHNEHYFGDLPNQVPWDSSQEIEVAAPVVARGIIEKMENNCAHDAPVVLRPHSYGAAVVHYILGKGNLFQHVFPDHPYVKIFKRTTEVYAFTGAYQGTPLMDVVCSNRLTKTIVELIGSSCVRGLSTSKVDTVGQKIATAAVPTYLIYSTKRSGFGGIPGLFIAKYLVPYDKFVQGMRNQNDDTLPIFSTKGCLKKKVMDLPNTPCEKIDPTLMEEFFHTDKYSHLEFRKIKSFMFMRKQ